MKDKVSVILKRDLSFWFILGVFSFLVHSNCLGAGTAVSMGEKLRLRKTPGLSSKVQGYLNKGEVVAVMEKSSFTVTVDSKANNWYEVVNSSGIVGWAFGGYLSFIDNQEELNSYIKVLQQEDGYGYKFSLAQKNAFNKLREMGPLAREAIPYLITLKSGQDPEEEGQLSEGEMTIVAIGIPAFIQLLKSSDIERRRKILVDLSYQEMRPFVHTQLAPLLAAALMDEDLEVRKTAVQIFSFNNQWDIGPDSHEAVLALSKSLTDPELAAHASHALGNRGPVAREAIPFLVNFLITEPYQTEGKLIQQYRAAYALNKICTDADLINVLPTLKKTSLEGTLDQKRNAANALMEFSPRDEKLISLLMNGLSSDDPIVYGYSAEGLGRFRNRATVAVPAIISKLNEAFDVVYEGEKWTSAYIDKRPAVVKLMEALREVDPEGSKSVFSQICQKANDPKRNVGKTLPGLFRNNIQEIAKIACQ